MLVISRWAKDGGFWSQLGCSGGKANIFPGKKCCLVPMGKTKPELYCNILTSKNLCPYFESQPLSMLTVFSVARTLPLKLNPIFL